MGDRVIRFLPFRWDMGIRGWAAQPWYWAGNGEAEPAAERPDVGAIVLVRFDPNQVDRDLPFRGIDHSLVRCDPAGPTLSITACSRIFDRGTTSASDHYGLAVDLAHGAEVRAAAPITGGLAGQR